MDLSIRAQKLPMSSTIQVSNRVAELKRQGKHIIDMSMGQPDFKTPKHICDAAIKAIKEGYHGYTENSGMYQLRELICDKMQRDLSMAYTPDNVLVSTGAKQSLILAMLSLLNEGDEVILPTPCWVSYPPMIGLTGAKTVFIPTTYNEDYKITAEQLEQYITPRTRAIIVCSPSNPTGSCYSTEEIIAIGKVLEKYTNISIITDEIYEYLIYDSKHVSFLGALPHLKDRIVYVNGFSKAYAMTGWRLGYMVASENITRAAARLQSQHTSAPSSISQMAGIAAYSHGMQCVENMRKSFSQRRTFILEMLSQIPNVYFNKPNGAFYIFLDVSSYYNIDTLKGHEIVDSISLCLYLLDQYGLALVPGIGFGSKNCIRISYATSMENINLGMQALSEALKSLKH